MAFVLGELEIPTRVTGMDGVLASITSAVSSLNGVTAIQERTKAITKDKGEETHSIFGTLSSAITDASKKLLDMAGVDMTPLIAKITEMVGKFGSMGIVVGGIVATLASVVTAGFAGGKWADEMTQLGRRAALLGGDADEAKKKVGGLVVELLAFGVSGAQTRSMLANALGRGMNIDQASNTVRAALALGESSSMGTQQALRALEAYQEMGVGGLRRLPIFRSDVMLKKSDEEIQRKLNDMIARGTTQLAEKADKDFVGMLTKIENAFGKVWFMMMKAFGPPVVAVVNVLAQAFQVMGNIVSSITPAFIYLVDLLFRIALGVGAVIIAKYTWMGLMVGWGALVGGWTALTSAWASGNMTLAGSFWAVVAGMRALLTLTFGKVAIVVGVIVGLASILGSIFEPIGNFFAMVFGWLGGLWDKFKGFLGLKTEALKMPDKLDPGMTAKATMMSVESLWEKFANAGAEKSTGQQQLEQLQQVNTHLTNISANTQPQGTGRPPVPAGAV